jgi:hypothetical protein
MLRLTEVRVSLKRSRSLRAKNKRVKQLIDLDGPNGHYREVFSIDKAASIGCWVAWLVRCFTRSHDQAS